MYVTMYEHAKIIILCITVVQHWAYYNHRFAEHKSYKSNLNSCL